MTKPLTITILSDLVEERSGIDKQGLRYVSRSQQAYAHTGKAFPQAMTIRLEEGQAAYPAGEYLPTGQGFDVGDYGSLRIGRGMGLVSVAEFVAAHGKPESAKPAEPAKPAFGAMGGQPAPTQAPAGNTAKAA